MSKNRIATVGAALVFALTGGVLAGSLASKVSEADRSALVSSGSADGSYQGTADVAGSVSAADEAAYASGLGKGKRDWPKTTITERTTTTVTVGAVKTLPADCAPVVRGDGEVFCSFNNPMGTGLP